MTIGGGGRLPERMTPALEAATGHPRGRRAPQTTSAELLSGLVAVSERLRNELAARGVDPRTFSFDRWPAGDLAAGAAMGERETRDVLRAAVRHALTRSDGWIRIADVLVALAEQPEFSASRWLADHGVDSTQLATIAASWTDEAFRAEEGHHRPEPPIGASARFEAALADAVRGWRGSGSESSSAELLHRLVLASPSFRSALNTHGAATDRLADPAAVAQASHTHDAAQVLGAAGSIAIEGGDPEIRISHVLTCLAAQPESDATRWLASEGVDRMTIVRIAAEV